MPSWPETARQKRARKALTRQLLFQRGRAGSTAGRERETIEAMTRSSQRVRELVASVAPIPDDARILEVGFGGRGLIFYFEGSGPRIGVDPLAVEYVTLFPLWQRRAATCAARGEALPFGDGAFDVVICNNVIDHAEDPAGIVRELVRVLNARGLMYFTVNVHHPIYGFASRLHAAWNAAGIPFEIGPFADHTVHMTLGEAQRTLRALPLRIVMEQDGIAAARTAARATPPRHPGDRLKRLFFKNARYEVVAVREATTTSVSPV